jgi:hypothetical protein
MRYLFEGTARDGWGNIIPGAQISVYLAGTTTAASVYNAYAGGVVVNYVTSSSDGSFLFYVDDGDYAGTQKFKIQIAKSGYTPQTFDYLVVYDINSLLDTDDTLAANSNSKIASQKATKHYVDDSVTTVTSTTVLKTLYNAQTILASLIDDTPVPLTVPEDSVVGRVSGGDIDALTITEVFDMAGSSQGDIPIRGASNWTTLPVGSPLQIPRVNSGGDDLEYVDMTSDAPIVPQTVLSAFTDAHGYPDFLWNGQEDFAPVKVPTGDAICNLAYSTNYASNAFDGSDSTFWQSYNAGAESGVSYIGLKNLKRNIKAIKYLNGTAANSITSVKIDYSTDGGVTWTNIQTTTVVNTASAWNEFTVAAYAGGDAGLHAIRILANANSAGYWCVYTIILLYNSNLDVCLTTADYTGSSSSSWTNPDNAFNNITGDYAVSPNNMSGGAEYCGQSGLASAVKAVRLRSDAAANSPKEIKLVYKDNVGDGWTTIATCALDITLNTWQTIYVPSYSPANPHWFALLTTANCAAAVWRVAEMELYLGDDTDISMTASATDPLQLVHSSGKTNYITEVTTADTTLLGASLVPGRTGFIYADRNASTGAITYGSKPICPQYGQEFDATKHCLMHFDGADASTVITDEYGSTWAVIGNAQLDTGGTPKFGTANLLLDGAGDGIKNTDRYWFNGQPFTIEGWWKTANQATANQCIIGGTVNGYPLLLVYTSSNLFTLLLSSAAASWDIATVTGAYTIASNTWYKFIVEWDGYYYRVWMGTSTATMTLICNVKSSTSLNTAVAGLELGSYSAGANYPLNGCLDEIRITLGSNRYGWSPVAEVAAFDKYDSDMTYFDIQKMKMYYGGGTSWTEVQRLFMGEAYMDAHGVTDMRNYALKGRYEGLYSAVTLAGGTNYNHNIGTDYKLFVRSVWRVKIPQFGFSVGDLLYDPVGGYSTSNYGVVTPTKRNKTLLVIGGNGPVLIEVSTGNAATITAANWEKKLMAQRGW